MTPMEALSTMDIVEGNLVKLERVWAEIDQMLPAPGSGPSGVDGEDAYRAKHRILSDLVAVMPNIDGFELTDEMLNAEAVVPMMIDFHEIGEPEALASIDQILRAQGHSLEQYRYRFTKKRRELLRRAIEWLADEIGDAEAILEDEADDAQVARIVGRVRDLAMVFDRLGRQPIGWEGVLVLLREELDGLPSGFAERWSGVRDQLDSLTRDEAEAVPTGVADLSELGGTVDPYRMDDPPEEDDVLLLVEQMKNGLTARATGGDMAESDYSRIRKTLVGHPSIGSQLPRFVKTCRTPDEFWGFIKPKFSTYAERRRFIAEQFNPILDGLELGDAVTLTAYERIDPPIGQGGYGQVYKYRHRLLDRLFAFKVFAPAFSEGGEGHLDRFFREARILFDLRHPDIIQVHDVGMMGRRPFIRMEFFDGTNLTKILRTHGSVRPDRALWLVRRLADALRHAHHDVRVVHRDIRPSNVMVRGQGPDAEVRLIDFGLGVFIERDLVSRITKTGQGVVGGHYTAPELVADPRLVNPASDIYSLGVLWYEMLVGRPPAGRDLEKTLASIAGVDASQVEVLLACVEDVDRRIADGGALVQALRAVR